MSEMISRRSFLKVAGVSVVGAAAFGLTGCGGGGGGGSTPTGIVYGKTTSTNINDWPKCDGVYFPCCSTVKMDETDDETETLTAKGKKLETLGVAFYVMNSANSGKTVTFEHALSQIMNDDDDQEEELQGSEQFVNIKVDGTAAEEFCSVGALMNSTANPGAMSVKDVVPGQSGIMILMLKAPAGWNNVEFDYHPNFEPTQTYHFKVTNNEFKSVDENTMIQTITGDIVSIMPKQ